MRFRYQVDFVSILDENFLANKKRAYEVCDLWEKEDLTGIVHFGILGDVASGSDYELLQRLRDVGCTYVSYGGEVASDRLLKEIKKHTTVKQMQSAIDATFKAGITPIMTFMHGYESENIEDYINTIKFWKRNQMLCQPFYLTAYPGCELWYKHKDKILAQYDGDLDKFLSALGDATDLTTNVSPFDDITLMGLHQAMIYQDENRIRRWAQEKGLLKEENGYPPVPRGDDIKRDQDEKDQIACR